MRSPSVRQPARDSAAPLPAPRVRWARARASVASGIEGMTWWLAEVRLTMDGFWIYSVRVWHAGGRKPRISGGTAPTEAEAKDRAHQELQCRVRGIRGAR